ncbi:histidinol-phosphatase [Pseudooceanicola sediminis]|uniref:Histidinol-phosphatase n=1 Tax=Pseudooceanicola sediminis TaxID=2211117 RepID=A0A399IZA8_9RHOB|nr:histidinol-phosphatase [Pseudooceanicola sediminis]KAA2313640.1 histidinol-phosphatase [Puniceibacterium sp. HSS470]RII38518.1 histidinol-phosphatase [Pseudooceanicola sediminis]|tara:strand:+ start:32243 stop:33046 length:804 start_codon:yes stop_codon:yes gene_type:complete
MDDAQGKDLLDTAHEMADAAGAAILPFFRSAGLTEDNKLAGGYDPVTEADRAAEQAMRGVLARRRPKDAILGEEFGTKDGDSGLTWVLDPIDGTRGFVSGTPTWGVLIGLSDDTGVHMGMIDQPYTGERFWGGFGQAQMRGPMGTRPLTTRQTQRLPEAILFTTFPEVGSDAERAAFQAVAGRVKLVRYGMDCYAYALVAAGQVDLVIECGLHTYDVQGPIGVIQAAGGIVTNWQGGPAHMGGQVIAAANAALHAEALDILAGMSKC